MFLNLGEPGPKGETGLKGAIGMNPNNNFQVYLLYNIALFSNLKVY